MVMAVVAGVFFALPELEHRPLVVVVLGALARAATIAGQRNIADVGSRLEGGIQSSAEYTKEEPSNVCPVSYAAAFAGIKQSEDAREQLQAEPSQQEPVRADHCQHWQEAEHEQRLELRLRVEDEVGAKHSGDGAACAKGRNGT